MRRTERLFEIIQILRETKSSLTANEIAGRLEVSVRTIYRDIQALQSMQVPIDGEAGVGYVMRQGYDLPPINFTSEEIEAIVVGLNLVSRTGDIALLKAAQSVSTKISTVRQKMESLRVSNWGTKVPRNIEPEQIRKSIRDQEKLTIIYVDEQNNETARTILPIAMIYYVESMVVVGWCELRQGFRHFRVDRIRQCDAIGEYFHPKGDSLRRRWEISEDRKNLV